MTAHLHVLDDQYYMKGKSKHLFWVMLAFLLFSTALEYIKAPLMPVIGRSVDSEALPVILAVVNTLVINGGWFILLLMYALACSVKTHRVVFIVLAVMQIPAAVGAFISNLYAMRLMTGQGGNGYEFILLLGVASALSIIVTVAWATGAIVVGFSKRSGALLRVAALILAGCFLLIAVNLLTARYLYDFLHNQFDQKQYIAIITVINVLLNLFCLAATGFFFGALSFGKRRQLNAPHAAVSA